MHTAVAGTHFLTGSRVRSQGDLKAVYTGVQVASLCVAVHMGDHVGGVVKISSSFLLLKSYSLHVKLLIKMDVA